MAERRLERALTLEIRIGTVQRLLARLTPRITDDQVLRRLEPIVEQLDALAFDINREVTEAREGVLEQHAHHMDPHPTAASVLGVPR